MKAIPNINCRVRCGVTLIQKGHNTSSEMYEAFVAYFEPMSVLYEVSAEEDFERLSPLTSCAPGLLAEIVNQLCNTFEIHNSNEQRLLLQSMLGTAAYMLQSRKSAETVVREVANPGGLTEVGTKALAESLPSTLRLLRKRMEEKIAQRRDPSSRR